jgi:20S proteasome subunit alpha 5
MVSTSVEKLFEVDSHVGCAVSGLTADAKMLVEHARVQAQHHTFVYNEPLKVECLTQSVCDLALRFGETGTGEKTIMVRRAICEALGPIFRAVPLVWRF